jgi:CheY-like chemotaxis protein
MRQELPHARIPGMISKTSPESAANAANDPTLELYELLAVVMGVCETLSTGLSETPQQAELARVGLLAADRAAKRVSQLRSRATPAAPAARKVLLVEDDADLLNLLATAFVREGFETYCAPNGRVGVDLLATLKPDLMVTDIVMPEVAAAIHEARRATPHTRVIAISGGGTYGASRDVLAWARELGADEVLAKPFRMSSLITAARLVLDRPVAPVPANETTPRAEAREASGLGRR